MTELGVDWQGDDVVIARQVIAAKKKLRKPVPQELDLVTALTDLDFDDTMRGSSTMTVTIVDPGWALVDLGFFDADEDGRLDPIDVNYPDGSKQWWRLTQVGLELNASPKIRMVFMERPAAYLMAHKGPVKASRADVTRAEFIKSLTDKVKAGGGIDFHCRELHKKQEQYAAGPSGGVVDPDSGDRDTSGAYTYPLAKHGTLGQGPGVGTHTLGNWQSDNAVDIMVEEGTAVYATEDGQIVKLGGSYSGGASRFDGYTITLKGRRNEWFYTHLRFRANLAVGQRVEAGKFLGASGSANGAAHLHIASKTGNPATMLDV